MYVNRRTETDLATETQLLHYNSFCHGGIAVAPEFHYEVQLFHRNTFNHI